jgi:hypothetical protein
MSDRKRTSKLFSIPFPEEAPGAGEKAGDKRDTANELEALPNADFALPLAEMVSVQPRELVRMRRMKESEEVPDKT